jgi:hypothetical protein
MSAIISLCERNGVIPGLITENISSISWKAVDDVTTPYSSYNAVLNLGNNSYTVYNYFKFTGVFTSIGNVSVTHLTGTLPSGVKLMSNPTITQTSNRPLYITPTTATTSITSNDLSSVGSSVNLLIGPAPNNVDGAGADGKSNAAGNSGTPLYSTYFITQLQVAINANAGDLNNVILQVSYNEV